VAGKRNEAKVTELEERYHDKMSKKGVRNRGGEAKRGWSKSTPKRGPSSGSPKITCLMQIKPMLNGRKLRNERSERDARGVSGDLPLGKQWIKKDQRSARG